MPRELGTRAGLSFFTDPECTDPEPVERATPDAASAVSSPRSRRRRRLIGGLVATTVLAGLVPLLLPSSALADPSANDWYRLRVCESGNNYAINTGNGHYGAYQFDLSTWASVGGHGLPSNASPAEQDQRALTLYHERGWQPWQCASIIGLTSSGSSGSTPAPAPKPTTPPPATPVAAVPAYPGHSFTQGDSGSALVTWQRQMRARGATLLTGTGYYGVNTLLVVKALQQQNGLAPEGLLGPQTWALAWTGKFVPSDATRGGAIKVPAFGTRNLVYGSQSEHVAIFQREMHSRGATTVTGTGQFGPLTLALVKALQQQNGLKPTGVVDQRTWTLAWTGSYHR